MALKKFPFEAIQKSPQRFWNMVDTSKSCWEWTGRLNKHGYGQISAGNTELLAHRAAYFLSNNDFNKSLCVLHKCDNRKCCNPKHLYQGTHAENMLDMKIKGRRKNINTKESNGRSKINQQIADKIRELKKTGLRLVDISNIYSISNSSVSRVCRMENWK